MNPVDVVFALTGDARRNSRALRQLRLLEALGCRVAVLTLGPPAAPPAPAARLRWHVVPLPAGRGAGYFYRVHRAFAAAADGIPARVYHASDLYTLPALHAAARRHGGRLVYDARERYPYVASTAGRPWVTRFWSLVERRYVRRADAVYTVSTRIAAHMARSYGIPAPHVLYNAPPRRAVHRAHALRQHAGVPDAAVVVLHQGQMRRDRGCLLLVEAMAAVRGAVLVFLGDGPLQPVLAQRAAALGLTDRVRFVPAVPPDDLLPLTADADIGVTLLEDTCLNHRYALPNKLFEYLMAGRPVLGSDLPEIRDVVRGCDVGLVADPSDAQAVAAALQRMIDDPAARARWSAHAPAVFETFGWETASQPFMQQYRSMLGLSDASAASR